MAVWRVLSSLVPFSPPLDKRRQKLRAHCVQHGIFRGFPDNDGRACSLWESFLVLTIKFPQEALHPVTDDGFPGAFSRGYPYLSLFPAPRVPIHREMDRTNPLPFTHHLGKFPVGAQSLFWRKTAPLVQI